MVTDNVLMSAACSARLTAEVGVAVVEVIIAVLAWWWLR